MLGLFKKILSRLTGRQSDDVTSADNNLLREKMHDAYMAGFVPDSKDGDGIVSSEVASNHGESLKEVERRLNRLGLSDKTPETPASHSSEWLMTYERVVVAFPDLPWFAREPKPARKKEPTDHSAWPSDPPWFAREPKTGSIKNGSAQGAGKDWPKETPWFARVPRKRRAIRTDGQIHVAILNPVSRQSDDVASPPLEVPVQPTKKAFSEKVSKGVKHKRKAPLRNFIQGDIGDKAAPTKKGAITIGFDYGCHSTKVVVRERKRNRQEEYKGEIKVLDDSVRGYPAAASPSVVCIDEGRFYFGAEALKRRTGRLYRDLKVHLLPSEIGKTSDVKFPYKLDATRVIAAYLVWGFQQVKKSLSEKEKDCRVEINVSIPMNYHGFTRKSAAGKDSWGYLEGHNTYLRIIQAAWKLSFTGKYYRHFYQGILVAEVKDALKNVLKSNSVIQSLKTRAFDVMPETMATIVSMKLDPTADEGFFHLVDIGAATTEMSVSHVGAGSHGSRLICYQDSSWPFGGNLINNVASDTEMGHVLDALGKQSTRTWYSGYLHDGLNRAARKRWSDLKIKLCGGATLHPSVALFFKGHNPKGFMENQNNLNGSVEVDRHVPSGLSCVLPISEEDLSLYAVANGLAVGAAQWPDIDDVDPLEP